MLMDTRLLIWGLGLWLAGTLALRAGGQYVLRPGAWAAGAAFVVALPAMAWTARRLCRRARIPPAQWPSATISLVLPTLVLDPFSSAFFPQVFPNMVREAAGLFGGLMLWCCAAAFLGVSVRRPARPA